MDLFEVENFEMTMAAARIIGRNMKPILASNDKLFETIMDVLETAIKEKPKASSTETILAINMNKSLEEIQKILSAIKQGIIE